MFGFLMRKQMQNAKNSTHKQRHKQLDEHTSIPKYTHTHIQTFI